MNIIEAALVLTNQFQGRDWFVNVIAKDEKPQKLIVVTKWQNLEILKEIPNNIDEYRVLVHFHQPAISMLNPTPKPAKVTEVVAVTASSTESIPPTNLDINKLIHDLDKLEKMCGSHTLQDIFYEIHDGNNAVTDLSSRYPEVRKPLEALYNTYGFDVIYEEIDG